MTGCRIRTGAWDQWGGADLGPSSDIPVTLHQIQYRSEAETSGSSNIAAAACRQQQRASPATLWGDSVASLRLRCGG